MKATAIRTIQVELTEREAVILCALAGGVAWNGSEAAKACAAFHVHVDEQLEERLESFADFFHINDDGNLAAR